MRRHISAWITVLLATMSLLLIGGCTLTGLQLQDFVVSSVINIIAQDIVTAAASGVGT